MKVAVTMAVMFFSLAWTINSYSAEPWAPRVPPPAKSKGADARLYEMIMVPERSTVPVPPYPGAMVRQTTGSDSMSTKDGKAIPCLKHLKFVTTDPPDKVSAFYKKELKGYKSKRMMPIPGAPPWDDLFWIGRDDIVFPGPEEYCRTPLVSIIPHNEFTSYGDTLSPKDTKTSVSITYAPK